MSATYNWRYKSGSVISYANGSGSTITIAASADNVKPSNCWYVALFGNDVTGNGSRQYPYKTINKAFVSLTVANQIIIIAAGTYREQYTGVNSQCVIVGDGDVTVDGTGYLTFSQGACHLVNISVRNFQIFPAILSAVECTFMDMNGNDLNLASVNSCLFIRINVTSAGSILLFPRNPLIGNFYNNTFINCMLIAIIAVGIKYTHWNLIFYRCNIVFNQSSALTYCLFYHCNFRFNSNYGSVIPAGVYPAVTSGFAQLNTLTALQAANSAGFPGGAINFDHCVVDDPLFNNESIGDYTLQFASPAKNASFKGTFIGTHSIAQPIKVTAVESDGGFEFASAVNLTIANDSLTLTDPALDAQIDTKVIVNVSGREIANLPSYGFMADRNGQYIDSIADLDMITKGAGDTLTMPTPYLVETGAIVYNGLTFQPGERLTTIAGQTTFTTDSGGVVREILEAPQRHTIMARFSGNGAPAVAGVALTNGYYYFVVSGSVTYNSNVYTTGNVFKAIDTNAFSGLGLVIVAFGTESFQHYELGSKPTSNNAGDQRTGTIIRGNGDPIYDRGGLGIKEFPVNAKFIQIRYIIKAHNLKP